MSGKGRETKATILSAIKIAGADKDIEKMLFEQVDKFVDNMRTNSADINARVLKQMSVAKVANAFAQESMTGLEKFSGKVFDDYAAGDPKGEATHMFIWDYGMKKVRFFNGVR